MPWGARSSTEIEKGFFSGFPRMQSCMFVILCNPIGWAIVSWTQDGRHSPPATDETTDNAVASMLGGGGVT